MAIVAILVLIGWVFEIEWLKAGLSSGTTMKANTAICLLLGGGVLSLLNSSILHQRQIRSIVQALLLGCTSVIVIIPLLTLVQYVTGVNLGIDQLLWVQPEPTWSNATPGRMAPNTAIALCFSGVALGLLQRHSRLIVAQSFAAIAWMIGLVGLIGHLQNDYFFYTFKFYTGMAPHTALCLLLLSSGILCAHPDRGLMQLIVGNQAGSQMMQRLVPIAIVAPVIVGGVGSWGYNVHLYRADAAVTLTMILDVSLFLGVAGWNAYKLNNLDQHRRQIAKNLRQTNADLQKLAAIVESCDDAIISKSLDGTILSWNASAERLFGYTAAEIVGRSMSILVPPDRAHEMSFILETIQQHASFKQYETVRMCKNGALIDVSVTISPIKDALGNVIGSSSIKRDISARKASELALQQSESQLRSFFNSGAMMMGIVELYDDDVRHLSDNATSAQFFDTTPDAMRNQFATELGVTQFHLGLWIGHYREAIRTQAPVRFEYLHRTATREIWLSATVCPIDTQTDEQPRLSYMVEDVTDRKRMEAERQRTEAALRESEATKQAIIEAIPDLLIRMRSDGTYLDFVASPEFNIINPTQSRDKTNLFDVLPPDLAQQRMQFIQRSLQLGSLQVYEQQFLNGDRLCYEEVRIVPLENEEVLAIVRDVTQSKQAEAELKAQQVFLRQIIDVVPNIIFVKDENGKIVVINEAGAAMHGTTIDAMVGNRETDFNPNFTTEQLEQFLALNREVMQTRQSQKILDQSVIDNQGNLRWYQTVINPLIHADGQVSGIVGASTDITDLKQVEQALQQAKEASEASNQAKSIFLANMSHELRTPLNVILGFAQIMRLDPTLPPAQQDIAQSIYQSGEHLLTLINDILDLSKIEAGRLTLDEVSFDLMAWLQSLDEMLRHHAESKGLRFCVEIAADIPTHITADMHKLRQVLINLLSNAIKFTDRGSVTLRVTYLSEPHAPRLFFTVEDTGIGIAEDEIGAIFEAFTQSRAGKTVPGGTGLGLTISNRFIALMQGSIAVQSTPGNGSMFQVQIPVRIAHTSEVSPPALARRMHLVPNQGHYRILIVDDQPENRQVLRTFMTQLGLEVKEARNGNEAIAAWQQWHPHLIWMDVRMPEMDGYEATQAIRALCDSDQLPVIIALTAQASMSDRTLALASGCNDFVAKPFREYFLCKKLSEHLGLQFLGESESPVENQSLDAFAAELATLMSIDWIVALHRAAQLGDDEETQNLIQQIPTAHHSLINQLSRLAHNYQFEQIKNLASLGKTRAWEDN